MKRILLLAMITTLLVACSSAYDKAMTKGQEALENDDFYEAGTQFRLALDEDETSEEAAEMIRLLDAYDTLRKEVSNENWSEVESQANALLKDEAMVPAIEKRVEETLQLTEETVDEQLKAQLDKAEKQVKEEELKKALKTLDDLEKSPFKDRIKADIADMREQIKEAEKGVTEKKRAAEKEKYTAKLQGLYDQYYPRAEELSRRFAHSIERGNEGEWHSLEPAFDKLLNDVYGAIRDNIPEAEFTPLLNEQRAWLSAVIAEDDELAKIGTRTALDSRMYILSEKKEERIYHLLNTYLKQ